MSACRVVAVAATVGGGKSTLVRGLAGRLPGGQAIHLDSYERFTQQPLDAIRRWQREGADPNALAIPGLAEDLASLKAGNPVVAPGGDLIAPCEYLVLETQFGRRHAATGRHIDFLVWIDVPLDIALARKVRQLAAGVDAAAAAAFPSWLHAYAGGYVEMVGELLRTQRDTVRAEADLIVNGLLAPDALLALVESEVLNRLK